MLGTVEAAGIFVAGRDNPCRNVVPEALRRDDGVAILGVTHKVVPLDWNVIYLEDLDQSTKEEPRLEECRRLPVRLEVVRPCERELAPLGKASETLVIIGKKGIFKKTDFNTEARSLLQLW